ncbi:hypothetical protein ACQ5SK_30935 [Bradyrhizobium japonicum]
MSKEPSATEPAAQATGIAYRWLLRGSTIALAAAALAWIAAIAPDVTNPRFRRLQDVSRAASDMKSIA